MELCMIAAVADNMAIGRAGVMPWHLPEDLKFFKKTTLGCPVIMGRRTWESLFVKPLPKRRNIVVTRSADGLDGAETARSLHEAYSLLEGCERCFVIGGGMLYSAAMKDADTLYLTHVHVTVEDADTFFPAPDMDEWVVTERSGMLHDEACGCDYEFVTYRRISSPE